MIELIIERAAEKSVPFTPFKLIEITENSPIYALHKSLSSEISNPSNRFFLYSLSVLISKKTFQHAHVKRFSKTSWARKKINFTPIV